MSLVTIKSSIVGRTALFAALLSSGMSVFIFAIIFAAQQSSYERQLSDHVIYALENLGFSQSTFTQEEANTWLQKNKTDMLGIDEIVYAYVSKPSGDIKNPFGKLYSEEPSTISNDPSSMAIFNAKGDVLSAYGNRLKPYERLGLIKTPLKCQKNPCSELRIAVSLSSLDEVLSRLRFALILAAVLIPLVTGFIVFTVAQHYLAPIRLMSTRMRELSISKDGALARDILRILPTGTTANTVETKYFAESIAILAEAVDQANSLKSQLHATESKANLARQVAHDIRSPAAALNYALADDEAMSDDKKTMIKKSLERIQGIASSLLSIKESGYGSTGLNQPTVATEEKSAETLQLASLLQHIIQEKKLLASYASSVDLRLVLDSDDGYGSFIHAPRKDIQTVISNILNNAFEGLEHRRGVTCTLASEQRFFVLSITDEGRGIPEEILPRIFARGFTHGKSSGNGLGLFHARTVLESMGGTINITSTVGIGTKVALKIPKAAPPPWFVPLLRLSTGTNVVICDDDLSVHELWQNRLQKTGINSSQVINFYNLSSFKAWWQAQRKKSPTESYLFLVDHDFKGDHLSGLDMVKTLGISWQAILVTNRFDNFSDEEYIASGQLALIPKEDVARIKIEFKASKKFSGVVLLEDDDFVREAWEFEAKHQGTELFATAHPRDLLTALHEFPVTTPIFIDSELGYGIKGEVFAKKLHELGFTKLIMTTGHAASHFQDYPFLHAVIKKEPPVFADYSGMPQLKILQKT
jgi:signal transduction histidine kinase